MSEDKLKILLVEDDEDDVVLFKSIVKKIPRNRFVVEWVNSYKKAQAEIEKDRHDVYVLDYRLGVDSGTNLLEDFDVVSRRQPFIILTGAADDRIEREAMELGAADYLVKGAFGEQLLSRVLNYSIQRKAMEVQRIEYLMEVNRSKDEFIAVASHELRTPATAVKQYIGMVLQGFVGELSEEQASFIAQAYESNERQLRTIDDILRVARLDLDKLSLKFSKLDIVAVAREVVNDTLPLIKKRNQTIELNTTNDSIFVEGDELYLRMVLSNIVDNATKYSYEKSPIVVDIKTKGKWVEINIADKGVGIASDDIDKLFVKFSRIYNPLSVERGGTGLGLYWAREIIQIHKGNISVKSKLGDGTVFTIHLLQATDK